MSGGLAASGSGGLPGAAGDFHGRPTRRLENGHCWIEALAEAGPRIVRFGLAGRESILAETPDAVWDQGYGSFELFGGHRLWFAPEVPECSIPESSGVTLETLPDWPNGLALVGPPLSPIGLRKRVEIRLTADAARVDLRHVIAFEGERSVELAVWPITQLKLGGTARIELPRAAETRSVRPNRLLVLWEYASWSDERLSVVDGLVAVKATPGPRFKIGGRSHAGVVSYERDGLRFTKTFQPRLDEPHADLGCNVEIYADEACIELETLGPLARLSPGEAAVHEERWELGRVG
jgi:hypothetical protein